MHMNVTIWLCNDNIIYGDVDIHLIFKIPF